jgi:hypothetical protein
MQFQKRFGTEKACQKQLFRLRWPEGFRCPAVNIVRPISIAPAQFFGSGGFLEIRVQLRLSVRTSHSLFPNSSKFRLRQGGSQLRGLPRLRAGKAEFETLSPKSHIHPDGLINCIQYTKTESQRFLSIFFFLSVYNFSS